MTIAELCAELVRLQQTWLARRSSLKRLAATMEDEPETHSLVCGMVNQLGHCADELQDVIDAHCL